MAKHPILVEGFDTMTDLAIKISIKSKEEVEGFFYFLSLELEKQANGDMKKGRKKLARYGYKVAGILSVLSKENCFDYNVLLKKPKELNELAEKVSMLRYDAMGEFLVEMTEKIGEFYEWMQTILAKASWYVEGMWEISEPHMNKLIVMAKDEETIEMVKRELKDYLDYFVVSYEVKPYVLNGKDLETVSLFGRMSNLNLLKKLMSEHQI